MSTIDKHIRTYTHSTIMYSFGYRVVIAIVIIIVDVVVVIIYSTIITY